MCVGWSNLGKLGVTIRAVLLLCDKQNVFSMYFFPGRPSNYFYYDIFAIRPHCTSDVVTDFLFATKYFEYSKVLAFNVS